MHNPESLLENKTHQIFWDIEIQMNHGILARRPHQELVNTKKS